MKKYGVLIAALILLAGGGFLTAILAGGSLNDIIPFLQQTSDPSASVMDAEGWQIEQLVLLIGFLLFNMVGIGVTIAAILWFLNRQVTIVKAMGDDEKQK